MSSGSMKWIPRNLLASSSFGFSIAHLCFSLSLAFFDIPLQSSGHEWSGLDVACRFVSLSPDHMYPSGGFLLNRVNWVKPVQESDKSLDPSIFQQSSMRLSCVTSKFVCVVLETSMYFSGIGNDSSLGEWSLTLGSRWWWYMKFPDMDQKSFRASPPSRSESWGSGGGDPSDYPRKSLWSSPRIGWSRIKVDVLSSWSPPTNFIRPSAAGNMNFPFSFGKSDFLCIESFCVDFRCVHRFQLLNVCNHQFTLPNSTRVQSISNEQFKWDFLSKLMDSWLVFRRDRVILNQPNGMIGPSKGSPKRLSHEVFPSDKRSWMFSQIGKAFHGICPPFFIQAWLQQYRRRTLFHSAHCSFSNPICFWSVWCWRTMIPG